MDKGGNGIPNKHPKNTQKNPEKPRKQREKRADDQGIEWRWFEMDYMAYFNGEGYGKGFE